MYYNSDIGQQMSVQMKTIGAREANQNFSKIMREAEAGLEFLVTRNGRPAVKITPVRRAVDPASKKKAVARMLKTMRAIRGKYDGPVTRNDGHD